jgi:DNA-binding winged helix-turn-helix (wHTH) protein/tetratricopeptide (TPR) repeat protein
MNRQVNQLYGFGPFRLDPRERLLSRDGKPIAITPKAFETLLVLVRNNGHLMLKDELLKAVWPDSFVEEVNLSQNVSMLRRALGDTAQESRFIATVPGKGYRFIAEVNQVQPDGAEQDSLVVERHSRAQVVIEQGRPQRTWAVPGMVVLLLIGALGGYRFYRLRAVEQSTTFFAPVKPRRSVAVLGFQNLSRRPDPAWLSTAFSEMLTTELAAGEQVRLVSSEEVALLRSSLPVPDTGTLSKSTLAQIRQAVGADLVVLGSYSYLGKDSGGQIRLDLRLQETAAGETIATISQTGTEADLFQLVSSVGAHLRERLGVPGISEDEAAGVHASLPINPDAARLYAEGLAKLRVFDALAARDLLGRAIQAEPRHALAHSSLSEAWSTLGYDQKAVDEVRRAFELSGSLARRDRLFIEARYRAMNKEWDKAIELYHTLFNFFPDDIEYGLRLANIQTQSGKKNEARATIQALRKVPSPGRDDVRIDLAEENNYTWMGQYKLAQQAAALAVKKARARGVPLLLARALWREGITLVNQGEQATAPAEEAQKIYAAAGDQFGVSATLAVVGRGQWYHGDREEAEKVFQRALGINRAIGNQSGSAFDLTYIAYARVERGDVVGANQVYEQALALYREIDDRNMVAYTVAEIGGDLAISGDPAGGIRLFDQALTIFRDVSDTDGFASSTRGKGNVLTTMGELSKAQQACQEALALSRKSGNKNLAALALFDLGNIARLQGDLGESRKIFSEALSLDRETGAQDDAVQVELWLAELAREEGRREEAKQEIHRTFGYLHQQRDPTSEVTARTLLAEIALDEANTLEATRAIEGARRLLRDSQLSIPRFIFTIAAARVQAATGKRAEARRVLRGAIAEMTKRGYVQYELEARLALCELDAKTDPAAGRAHGQVLAKDARAKGFILIARKALALGT